MLDSTITFQKNNKAKQNLTEGTYRALIIEGHTFVTPKANSRALKLYLRLDQESCEPYYFEQVYLLEGKGVYYFHQFLDLLDLPTVYGFVDKCQIVGRHVFIDIVKKYSESNQYAYWFEVNNIRAIDNDGEGEINV